MNDRPAHTENQVTTLVELLADRATGACARKGFTFFQGDDLQDEWLRYSDLHHSAQLIANHLNGIATGNRADASMPRAIVLCPPGPTYLQALFGTLYGGMTAVTAYPPRTRRRDERLDHVVKDSGATVAIVDQSIFDRREQIFKSSPLLKKLQWVNADDVVADDEWAGQSPPQWASRSIDANSLAVLQYTSGSTSDPKGVCLTHRNLMTNLQMIYQSFELERHPVHWSVTWLPPYHDMGLIGGLLQVMYAGECAHVIPPASFIQKPIRWLKAIDKYKASVSGGPNFAYDACVERIPREERASLDLSSWTLAFTGAEPIRKKSLERFAEAFSGNGFKATSFFPCYGLAEATLIVTGGPRNHQPKYSDKSGAETGFAPDRSSEIISCGAVAIGQQVCIVDLTTLEPLPTGEVGEIWVAGDNVSPGYWQRPETNREVFDQTIDGDRGFMRTGDLGFFEDGELYVTGRLKELIIIRGRNFQPSDIESFVADCNPLLVKNSSAAFEVKTEDETGLVIVQEVERYQSEQLPEIVRQIRQRVVEVFDLEPHRVVLIPRRALPKTSSGKVKRLETRKLFETGELDELPVPIESTTAAPNAGQSRTGADISGWLVERLAKHLQVAATEIDVARPFVQYGLDSVSAVQIAADLEAFLGRAIPATLLYEAPTINAVAEKLSASARVPQSDSSDETAVSKGEVRSKDVAVIGVACRLPGIESCEAYWDLLHAGQSTIAGPPPNRADCVSDDATTDRAGWIADPDMFDAALFGISPREARCIDPQHRLLLESCWRAVEDAGLDPNRLAGTKTGVFVGISNRDYERLFLTRDLPLSTYTMTGNAASMSAHRVSYHFDLIGPSISIDTACSSSLVAVHQAARAIQAGDCDSALVAGVNLILSPEVSETLSDAEMLSPDGLCKTFDASADGYGRGEGCIAILLKPLSDALADGDRIRAVIRGTAVNQDGLTNGITAPNGDSQVRLYRDALADAAMEPDDVSRLEAHGTGTVLGDPIEVNSLLEVYGRSNAGNKPCHLGAVKANLGHLEAAAGLAGLLKVVLELEHRETVAQPHLSDLNPHISLSGARITIPSQTQSWNDSHPRIAAVSSFGFGGTNAHVIVSEATEYASAANTGAAGQKPMSCLLALSASDPDVLLETAADHARQLELDAGSELGDFSVATQRQKTSHRYRVAIVGESSETIRNRLNQFADGTSGPAVQTGSAPTEREFSIAFMFSGQGGQHVGMGRGIFRHCKTFREWVVRCDTLLEKEFGYRVSELLISDPATNGSVAKMLDGPASQTGLFVLQFALARTLNQWGIRSSAVLGHSMGEYAAAAVAGVMDWSDALRLTAVRAKCVSELESSGAMTVVFAPVESVERQIRELDERLSVAAIDGPSHIVVSGPANSVQTLERVLEQNGTETRPLRIAQAFHSRLMEPILEAIGTAASGFELSPPNQTYISTLTGTAVSRELQAAKYWMSHTIEPVQFSAALESLADCQCDVAVELGPHPTLCTLGQLNSHVALDYQPTLIRSTDDWQSMMEALASLYARGANVDFSRVDTADENPKRIILPGYPFRRKRFWIDRAEGATSGTRSRRRVTVKSPTTSEVADEIQRRRQDETEASGTETVESQRDQLDRYAEAMPQVDKTVVKFMRNALTDLGVGLRAGDRIVPEKLVSQGLVAQQHGPLVGRMCEILGEEGLLVREPSLSANDISNDWTVMRPPPSRRVDLSQEVIELEKRYPEISAELRLAARCGASLAQILRGDLNPLTLLFPNGDTSDLESLYRASPIARQSNRLVADAVSAAIRLQTQPGREGQLRVLEIGAGTGGTTSFVLPTIADQIETYVFTDASPLLIADAAGRFDARCCQFKVLDIESSPFQQGFDEGSFDVVIAANVLHATRDLAESLSNAQKLLAPGGFVVALEGVRPERFLDLVFGLTEGWWRFADKSRRPNYPLISESTWVSLLSECGFVHPVSLTFPLRDDVIRQCQSVLLAAKDPEAEDEARTREGEGTSIASSHRMRGSGPAPAAVPWIKAFHEGATENRPTALEEYFRTSVSAVLEHEPQDLDLDQPVSNLGIDSLMAIQMKNRLEADLGLSVPMVAFLQGKTIRQLIKVALENDGQEETTPQVPTTDLRPEERTPSRAAAMPTAASLIDRPAVESTTGKPPQTKRKLARTATGEQVLGPMSVGQLALWMIHQRSPRGPAYNFAFAARTSGVIDRDALTKACRSLLKRHPVLRTCYRLEGATPVRVLSATNDVVIDEKDCHDWRETRVVNWIRELADQPFDLDHGPIIRFTLIRCQTGDVLSITMHHIAADLWSMDVLIQELLDLYSIIVGGGTIELGPLPATYDAYVEWEQSLDGSSEGATLWDFWRKKLDGAPHILALPTTYSRPREQTYNGQSFSWSIPAETVDALREVAHAERTTMFTIVLTAYQAFLTRVCGQDDLLVGTVSASRGRSEWEGIVGYFLNHLVLRTRMVGSPTFRELLRDSQREVLDALENQEFPFAKLVEKVRPVRDPSRSPLVQTMFIWDKPRHPQESHGAPGKTSDRLRLKPLLMEQRGAPFDLTLIVFELDDGLELTFRYNTDLFSNEAIETLSQSMESLIETIAFDPDMPVRSIPLATPEQEDHVAKWNSTDVSFAPGLSGYPMFRQWVEQTPDAIAIQSTSESLTYRQADLRATQVANELRVHAIGPGDVVGLLTERGVDAIVAILGIWKAGAAYLPLDPDHPAARLQAICNDASPGVLLTCGDADALQSLKLRCPTVDLGKVKSKSTQSVEDFDLEVEPESPAYIIYTSGSTGQPKGVVVAHRGVANLAVAQHQSFGITPEDCCLQFASLSFDASVFEIIMAIHAGATLHVFESAVMRSTTTEISDELRQACVNVVTLPPSVLAAIPSDNLPDLHTVISAGEACSAAIVQKWGGQRRMFNAYGPTETTVWATIELCVADGTEPTLGRPIANVHAYVVDQNLEPTPIGVPGELCISGPGLAIEYRNKPGLTSEAFVPNPFDDRFDATMYRTGDRVRWNHDGKIEFLGRVDDQVKIDGHRIEPGEIAAVIRQIDGVENAFVTTIDSDVGASLVSYFVLDQRQDAADSAARVDAALLRQHLTDRLPCYMVPKHFIPVSEFPLTVNGKVDTASLPKPTGVARRSEPAAEPTTDTETALVEVWRAVLELDEVGIHDNFFDLGGASLQALRAADMASKEGFTISAERMFRFQTIAELARAIDQDLASGDSAEKNTVVTTTVPASIAPSCQMGGWKQTGFDSPAKQLRMVVESLGMYLPPDTQSTADIIAGCQRPLDFPLERMTGIASRHVAGREEFSIDLARKAALDCLSMSRFDASEIDLLIAANISRYDGPDFEISYEPSTASKLRRQIGATSAVAFDVCNACAGFFTALAVAQSRLLSGESRRALVVSGEYITHLTNTAQLEIDGFLDPRLACLTLGDAGVATIVELSDDGRGFETLDLYTAGRHHELCVAKATDQAHGGAIMLTDAIKASAVTLDYSVGHARRVLNEHLWDPGDVQHLIMHQTSATTLDGAVEELNRQFGRIVCSQENTVNNLLRRGNTASTTHWVAVMDLIRQGRIQRDDKAVFAISGSGQTIGTALYQFDKLPDRVIAGEPSVPRLIRVKPPRQFGVRIAAVGVDQTRPGKQTARRFSDLFVIESAATAAQSCLQSAGWNAGDVEALIHTGVYRDEFLSEPAIAAILAGELEMNADRRADSPARTLAFDLADGGRGSLTACNVLATMIRNGEINRGIITSAEIENNSADLDQRGIAEMGSAIALEQTDDPTVGFGDFFFQSYPEYAEQLAAFTKFRDGRPTLMTTRSPELDRTMAGCICDTVAKFLAEHEVGIDRYTRILISAPGSIDRRVLTQELSVSPKRIVMADVPSDDGFTSSLALMLHQVSGEDLSQAKGASLLVAIGAGIEVACVEYRWEPVRD